MDNIVELAYYTTDERNVTEISVIDIMQQVPLQDVMGVRASDVPAADWVIRQH